jgi:hypothetical protein
MIHIYTFDNLHKNCFSDLFKTLVENEMDAVYNVGTTTNVNTSFLHSMRIDNKDATVGNINPNIGIPFSYNIMNGSTLVKEVTFPSTHYIDAGTCYRKADEFKNISDKLHLCILKLKINHSFKFIGSVKKNVDSITIRYGFMYNDISSSISTQKQLKYNPRYQSNSTNQYLPHPITYLPDLDVEFTLTDKDEYTGTGTTFDVYSLAGYSDTNNKILAEFENLRQNADTKLQEIIDRNLLQNNIVNRNLIDVLKINVSSEANS